MTNGMILYKGVIPERTEDFPNGEFGALVVAARCNLGCPGCCNEHLKNDTCIQATFKDIIDEVCSNPLHKWMALGGLEWTYQVDDMMVLALEARRRGLNVIIYTGRTLDEFIKRIGQDYWKLLAGCYLKVGSYDEKRTTTDRYWYGIKMASFNQYVMKIPGPFETTN